uniref:BPTI/Kunitz inhibitor domain-containing protein n=1 Tax=Prolemur simus TaxID=1328070 RepID=A0A8C8Z2U4_PROSS
MKPEWTLFSLWFLIFSMILRTLSGEIIPLPLRKELCESGHLGEYCNYPPVAGTCKLSLTRFYYNTFTFLCEPFIFTGCGGNRNNFKQKYICEEYCITER